MIRGTTRGCRRGRGRDPDSLLGIVGPSYADAMANRQSRVDVGGVAMPMQAIETIDEPCARTEAQGNLFDSTKAHSDEVP